MDEKLDDAHVAVLEEHLPYEHDMLDEAYEAMTSHPIAILDRPTRFTHNSRIENFWLHARNLIEFYEGSQGGDLSASHFTRTPFRAGFKLKKGAPAVENAGKEFVTLINEQVCHLKSRRFSADIEKLGGYDPLRVKEAIDRAMLEWQETLTKAAEDTWKRRAARSARQVLLFVADTFSPSSQFGSTKSSSGSEYVGGPTLPPGPERNR